MRRTGSQDTLSSDTTIDFSVSKHDLNKYLATREISGITDIWIAEIKHWLIKYLEYVHWNINEDISLNYFKILRNKYSTTSYRKKLYQIRKFLSYLGIEWSNKLNPPPEPEYLPKRITSEIINETLSYYQNNEYFLQIKAIILLGSTSGMRAEELYQLTTDDIDLDNRIIRINHNPSNGQSTKTKRSRVSFFTEITKQALLEYIEYYHQNNILKCLFSQSHIERQFRDKNVHIHVKDLRKYFSQEWDRRGGPTSIKKILMGHSLKGDVDLMHYNCQSEEDLKKIYDKVMNGSTEA